MFKATALALSALFLAAAGPIQPLHNAPAQQQKTQPDNHNERAANDEQNSASAPKPMPVIVSRNLHVTASSEAKYRADPQQEPKKSFWDFSLTDLLLTIFTAALVGVGAFQWNAMMRQERQLRLSVVEGRKAAQRQSHDMKASIAAAAKAAEAAQDSADSYIRSERPFVYTGHLVGNMLPNVTHTRRALDGTQVPIRWAKPSADDIWVEYAFRNAGRTAAIIKEICVGIEIAQSLPRFQDYGKLTATMTGYAPLQEGQLTPPVKLSTDRVLTDEEVNRVRIAKLFMFFIGYITFTDVFGYLYTRGFAWRFSEIGRRFEPVGGKSWNYTIRQKNPDEDYD